MSGRPQAGKERQASSSFYDWVQSGEALTFTTLAIHRQRPLFLAEHWTRVHCELKTSGHDVPPLPEVRRELETKREACGLRAGVARLMFSRPESDGTHLARLDIRLEPPRRKPATVRLLVMERPTGGRANHKGDAWRRLAPLARTAGEEGGFDALLRSGDEFVECCRGNLFVVQGRGMVTPPDDRPLLHGIARHLLLTCSGFPIAMRPIRMRTLARARAIFLSNSVRGVVPVNRITDGGQLVWTGPTETELLRAVALAWRRIRRQHTGIPT